MNTRKLYTIIFLAFFFSIKMEATVFLLEEWQEAYNLQIQITEDKGAVVSPQNIEKQLLATEFQIYGKQDFALKTNQYYWGKIQLKNNLPQAAKYTEWVLSMSYSLTDLELFVQQPDGTYQQQLNGFFRPYTQKEFVPRIKGLFTRIVLPPKQTVTLFFRAKSERFSILPNFWIKMQHTTIFYEQLQKQKSNHTLFIGFIAMMLLYNLILYFFGRDRSFIYYSIYLLMLLIYSSYRTGDLADWLEPFFFPNHPEYGLFSKLTIYIALMAYIAFMCNFLDLKNLLPKWNRFFNILLWLGFPWIVVDTFAIITSNFSYMVAEPITFTYILLFVISTSLFIFHLYKTKDKKGYFIVAGILVWFLGISVTITTWAQSNAFSLLYLKIGSVLEIIVFSLGLAYRQRENVKAKQQAHFQLERNKILQEQEQVESIRIKELDKLKSRLYTNITHEFRTPLTVIMGMIENIKGHTQEKKLIRRNSKNLLQLINQLLDLSKVESGKLKLHKIQGDIIRYIKYLTESFQSLAKDKGIKLVFYSEQESLIMDYDEVKIQHIIYNLLSNALKFTDENGQVLLHLKTTTLNDFPHLSIKIIDSGIGISKELIPHIFDRFYQADNSNTRKEEGTGIGLALVKELVQLMDGKIKVQSQEEKGTEFIIWLPIENEATAISQKKEETTISTLMEAPILNEMDNHLPISTIQTANLGYPILLLIEDNIDVTSYIQSILDEKYTIHTAKNGQLGIDKAIELVPDIIISDVMMPLKNGYEVCKNLKQDERTSHIPIILLTAKATQADKIEGLKYGADAYLTKPFYKEELFIRLEKLVAIRQKLQERYASYALEESSTLDETQETIFLKKLKTIVAEQLHDANFGVPELATLVQMSRSQLYRKIKALTDKSIAHFIRSIRLQKGMNLLKDSDLNISEIAYKVGFADPNYFSRSFQQEFGVSPRDFRK